MKTTRVSIFGWILAVSLVVASCNVGSGEIVGETRDVGSFTSIEVSGAVDVVLVVEPGADVEVVVNYDDNLLDQIVTRVEGDTLLVATEGNVSTFGGGRFVSVTTDHLEGISVSGASDLDGSGELVGYQLDVEGASDVNLRELTAEIVELDVSGASDVRVYASTSVDGEVSGASDVRIYGDPDTVQVDSSGASDVNIE